jgi:hypothetical protein
LDIVDQGGSYVVVEGEGFTLRTDLTDIDLARDEFDTFEVAFSPTDIQNTYNGTVTIKTNDPEEDDSNGYSFAISGRGSDTPNISLSTTGLETWEAEEDVWKQVDVTINYKPTRDVTVSFDISDTNEVMSDKTELVFIWTDTYPNTQSVNFRGVDDGELDLDQVVRVTTSVTSLDPVYDDFPLEDITIVNRNRHFTSTCSQEQYSETVKSGETIICKHATQIDITGTIVRSGGTAGFYAPTVTGSDTTTLEAGSKVQIAPSVDYLDTGK